MKVSVISTLKNEADCIKTFLDSLLNQSRPPDEIVICDGGSTDGTTEIIQDYISRGAPVKLIIEESSIARGRNIAIRNAQHEIIAVTDAGCRIDKDWLKNIIRPFEQDSGVMVVGGFFKADPGSFFEKCSSTLILDDHDNIDISTWLPSSRSIAFKKEAWARVGGYPEYLPFAGEDTVFDLSLKKAGYRFEFARDAVVYWRPRSDVKSFFRQYFHYSRGDGQALTHWTVFVRKILLYLTGVILLFASFLKPYLLGVLFFLAITYLVKKSARTWRKIPEWRSYLLTPLLVVIHDIAEITGFLSGFWDRFTGRIRVGNEHAKIIGRHNNQK